MGEVANYYLPLFLKVKQKNKEKADFSSPNAKSAFLN